MQLHASRSTSYTFCVISFCSTRSCTPPPHNSSLRALCWRLTKFMFVLQPTPKGKWWKLGLVESVGQRSLHYFPTKFLFIISMRPFELVPLIQSPDNEHRGVINSSHLWFDDPYNSSPSLRTLTCLTAAKEVNNLRLYELTDLTTFLKVSLYNIPISHVEDFKN